jgi:hypothetical protein
MYFRQDGFFFPMGMWYEIASPLTIQRGKEWLPAPAATMRDAHQSALSNLR